MNSFVHAPGKHIHENGSLLDQMTDFFFRNYNSHFPPSYSNPRSLLRGRPNYDTITLFLE